MKAGEMVELVQQHHPDLGAVEIVKMINRASDDFTARTRLLDSAITFPTIKDQRFYALDDKILDIRSVDLENDDGDSEGIPHLIGRPGIRDIT